jgi:hypothetical protein
VFKILENTLSDCSLLYVIFSTAISVADGSGHRTFRESGTVFLTLKAGSGYGSRIHKHCLAPSILTQAKNFAQDKHPGSATVKKTL